MKNNLKYHPIRYGFQLKPVLDSMDQAWSDICEEDLGIDAADFRDKMSDYFLEEARPLYDPLVGLSEKEWVKSKKADFAFYDNYLFLGSNIFHLQPEIIELFKRTDIIDVDLASFRLPFPLIYLYFGESAGFKVGDQTFIDGAYIMEPLHGNEKKFGLAFHITNYNKTLNYSRKMQNFLLFDSQALIQLGDKNKLEKLPVFKKINNLILNTMLFFSSKYNDTELSFDPDTPKSIVNKFNEAKTSKLKKRIENKAKSQGFSRINFVGNSFKNFSVPGSGKSGISPSSHWRRGHWRNQAYGKSNSKHKLVWILPTLVNKDKGPAKTGHIYNVETIKEKK